MAFVGAGAAVCTGRAFAGRAVCERKGRSAARRQVVRAVVVDVGSPDELTKALESADDSLVVIDYSTTWCGPCKVIGPKFEEFSEAYDDVVFLKVMGDVGEGAAIMKSEGIRSVPAFHFWKSNEKIDTFAGAKADEIEARIKKYA